MSEPSTTSAGLSILQFAKQKAWKESDSGQSLNKNQQHFQTNEQKKRQGQPNKESKSE